MSLSSAASSTDDDMGLRTGDEYLAGLGDDREIWFNGQKIKDVREFPGLRNGSLQHEA